MLAAAFDGSTFIPHTGSQHFRLLHGVIVDLFAHFGLCLFALRASVNQTDRCVVLAILHLCIWNGEIAVDSPRSGEP